MSTETVYIVVNVGLAIISILFFALVGVFSKKKVKALVEKEWKTVALYDTAERLCIGLACVILGVFLLNVGHQSVMHGLFVLKSKLEVLAQ